MVNNKLKLGTCITLLIGAMFGSAIFSLSGLTIYEAGPASLISWFLAAIIMLIYGLLMAEMASYYPKSGGVYVFPAKAISGIQGKWWGWISCWCYILGNFAAIAFSAIYVGVYLSVTFPVCSNLQVPIAIASILLVFILNIIKLKNTGKINNILVFIIIFIMIIFCVCVFTNEGFNPSQLMPFFNQGNSGTFGFVSMVPIALMSYSAIVTVAFMAEDIHEPKKTIPKSSIIAISILALLYLLIIFATLGVVSSEFLAQNPDLQMVPLFAACSLLTNIPWLTAAISIASVVALITTMLFIVSLNARAIKAAADDKILPKSFASVSKNDQPIVGVIITVIISAIISLFPNYVEEIVNLGILFNIITIFIVVISVIIARKKTDLPKDVFKLKGGNIVPVIFLIVIVACNITNIITSNLVLVCIYTILSLLAGLIIFLIAKKHML